METEQVDLWVLGAGYVGLQVARAAAEAGLRTVASRRDPAALGRGLAGTPARGLALDLAAPPPGDAPRARRMVFAASPGQRSPAAYAFAFGGGPAEFLRQLAERGLAPERAILVSSTSAFAAAAGGWVDEESPDETEDPVQGALAASEAEFLARARALGVRAQAARFGGIYGPGRERLLDEVESGRARFDPTREEWSNRIHRDDGARAILHQLFVSDPPERLCVVDTAPARRRDVLAFLADRLGRPRPAPLAEGEDASDRRGAGRGEKRVLAARLLRSGFVHRYPDYQSGYGALIDGRRARPAGAQP